MKNSLQLELQMKIKRANRFLVAKQYSNATQEYTKGLQLYEQNKSYNECVSEQFPALLYSLRANAQSLNLNTEQAQADFDRSVAINPYSPVTFSRRAKHFMKEKRYRQAIQDIDVALMYDPQNITHHSLLNSIQSFVNKLSDQVEKQQILRLVHDVKQRLQAKPPTQSESDEEDEEILLNFSQLKKIDRESVRMSPTKIKSVEKRMSIIEFKGDEIVEYQNQDVQPEDQSQQLISSSTKPTFAEIGTKLSEQQNEIKQLEEEEEEIRRSEVKISQPIILTKSMSLSRKSILRRPSLGGSQEHNIFISTPGQKSNLSLSRRSSISASSIKDIDGKVVKHEMEKIKFKPRPSLSRFAQCNLHLIEENEHAENQKENLSKTTPASFKKLHQRKSCMRLSNKFSTDQVEDLSRTTPVKMVMSRKSSNFDTIKSIDGKFVTKSAGQEDDELQTPIDIKIESSSDDENNEHDIFGNIRKRGVLEVCENMEDMPDAVTLNLSKKKSILKKDSFLDSSMLSWKMEKKKSVLFSTE